MLERRKKDRRDDCALVFHQDGQPIQRRTFLKHWTNACTAAKLTGRIPHDMRRSAVRNLERAAIPRKVAMQMVGHQTESIYRRYHIVAEADIHAAGAQLDQLAQSTTSPGGPRAERALDAQRDFEATGNNPLAWWQSAETLLGTAALLRPFSVPRPSPLFGELMDVRSQVCGLLLGYAIECLLKARGVADGNRLADSGRLHAVPEAGDHELLQLAKAVGVQLNGRERDVLNRLSAIVIFAGRYPIPKRASRR